MSRLPSPLPQQCVLAGNQASARGALEAGARLAIGYPGTPATPAIEYLLTEAGDEMRVEWAVNEKVALEIAAGHSWAGQRSFVAIKMSGLNVAIDALLSIATTGTRGGLVIYVGDDPGMYYGMVEQDSRLLARLAMLPMVEPASPREAKDLTLEAFAVSEAAEVPVLIRGTSTTANTYAPVLLSPPHREHRKSDVPLDIERYTKAGRSRCLTQHSDTLVRLRHAGELLDGNNILTASESPLGVLATASVWSYVEESIRERQGRAAAPNCLRVSVVNPMPDGKILELLGRCRRVLVLEELEPLLEERARALASTLSSIPEVLGKRDGLLPGVGDLDPEMVEGAIQVLEGASSRNLAFPSRREKPHATDVPTSPWAPRILTFCPGCPHRSTYAALLHAIEKAGYRRDEVIVTGDIGCTILGMNRPFALCRTEVAMGSSIALAQGFAYAGVDRPIVAAIGDSTFFHAGIPPLLNAAAQNVNLTVLILDNSYASMTGHQPSLHVSPPNPMSIEELARAARVRRVRRTLPYYTKRLSRILAQSIASPGVQVVIAEAPCVARGPRRTVIPLRVRPERCTGPELCSPSCLETVGCPALNVDEETGRATVAADRCLGCGLCASACQRKAIRRDLGARRRTL